MSFSPRLSAAILSLGLVLSTRTTEAFQSNQRSLQVSAHPQTKLYTKNSDRAHIERNLEDAMNNDWRVFRAKLVAQEQAEEEANKGKSKKSKSDTLVSEDERLAKQGQLGEMFAQTISSIFKGNKDQEGSSNGKNRGDIFKGDRVGGALPLEEELLYHDPFVSAEEIPILMKPQPKINKHRWAHDISHVEPGCVLIANEKLGGVFHQTVVLVIEHHETSGSTGIVINRYV